MTAARSRPLSPTLARALDATALALVAGSVVVVIVRGDLGRSIGNVIVGVLIAVPLLRVAYTAVAWRREGDRRFAGIAVALLAVAATGALLSLLR